MSVLIIGYGNTLRGDDGLGWVAAERLAAVTHSPDVSVMMAHQLGIEMVEDVKDADQLILIDVTASDEPGTIACKRLMASRESYGMLEHHVHPEVVLTTCQALYDRAPQSYLFTVGGESFDFNEGLSDVVEAALPELIRQVLALIESFHTESL